MKDQPSVESPPSSLELKDLPTHLEYAFLDEERKCPVIIPSILTEGEKIKLLEVLRVHKGAIGWKIINIKGINPSFCNHKILMEDDFKSVVQPQSRLNPKMQEVVKKESIKLLDAGIIFPIFASPWSSPVQIPLAPDDQEKTTFTCPYSTFANKHMPFGHCNAPATFQRSMEAIFHDMIEDSMEVFTDDFSVFESFFDHCLCNLKKMMSRCIDTNLLLNWEKCHFMVHEGIVLGHRISSAWIEVD
ncbi:uncharacterized protein LOC143608828 [Bidens hawaiensis]|uniref:uncharacterized protein LOC143608828 n=1 Tax=Bidens hawaiensis TaxID=980011 RepID=UPI00404B3A46